MIGGSGSVSLTNYPGGPKTYGSGSGTQIATQCPKFVMDLSQNPDPKNAKNKSGVKKLIMFKGLDVLFGRLGFSLDPDQAKEV